uniref:NADH:ubiquinone reductase (H(+)-translocating) n=1 Tax=Echeneibothrium multiloculatum TaxID=1975669 RepID=A0A8K1SYY5_9CEST|nr:NADH dehydrogenase subunit 5 [Echeneibothrium multiloculatum]
MLFSICGLLTFICGACIFLIFSYSINFSILTLNGSHWDPLLFLDFVGVSILLMLFVCFSYALFYTGHYFGHDYAGVELNKIICLFVSVMASLVLTGDFLSTLVFWEYLGVVSFFLILFYSNYLSLRSSVITLVSSRYGDVCLFLIIALSIFNNYPIIILAMVFFFIVFTKSASFPFTSWLLEAMRAPTPVSSLVHSSTLVAAGVWFSMRYDMFNYMENSSLFLSVLLLTIFITGICCFFFLDLKKIVALSTCNNIAWCIVYLLCGNVLLSLFQLVSHGVSKCLLFMLVGDVMSGTGGSQASNCVYTPPLYGNWGLFGLFCVILGLSGAPFIGVFFTKHFLLSTLNSSTNVILITSIMCCVFLSYFYSFRLCRILANLNSGVATGVLYAFSSGIMVYAWLFVNYSTAASLDETTSVSFNFSSCLLIFQLFSCLTAYFLYNSTFFRSWSSYIFGCDNLVESCYNMFNLLNRTVSLFFYRWDNQMLLLFNNNNNNFVNIYSYGILNIIMLSTIFFLTCWFIL